MAAQTTTTRTTSQSAPARGQGQRAKPGAGREAEQKQGAEARAVDPTKVQTDFMLNGSFLDGASVDPALEGVAEEIGEEEEQEGGEGESGGGGGGGGGGAPMPSAPEGAALSGTVQVGPAGAAFDSWLALGYIDLNGMRFVAPSFEIMTPRRDKSKEDEVWYRTNPSEISEPQDHNFPVFATQVGVYSVPETTLQNSAAFKSIPAGWSVKIDVDAETHQAIKTFEQEHIDDVTYAYEATMVAFYKALQGRAYDRDNPDIGVGGSSPEEAAKSLIQFLANDTGDAAVKVAVGGVSAGDYNGLPATVGAALVALTKERCKRTLVRDQNGWHTWGVNGATRTVDKATKTITLKLARPAHQFASPAEIVG